MPMTRHHSWSTDDLRALHTERSTSPPKAPTHKRSVSTSNPRPGGWLNRRQQHMAAVSAHTTAPPRLPPPPPDRPASKRLPAPIITHRSPHTTLLLAATAASSPSKPSRHYSDPPGGAAPYNDVPSVWRPEHRRHRRTASWDALSCDTPTAAGLPPSTPRRHLDVLDCRVRFWAQLRCHRTLARALVAWAAASPSSSARAASPLVVRMEAMESEMMQWRDEARERLRQVKQLSQQLRDAEQLHLITYGAVLMYRADYHAMHFHDARREWDSEYGARCGPPMGPLGEAPLEDGVRSAVLDGIDETGGEEELELEEEQQQREVAQSLLNEQTEEDWCRLLSDTETEVERGAGEAELQRRLSLPSAGGSASELSESPDRFPHGRPLTAGWGVGARVEATLVDAEETDVASSSSLFRRRGARSSQRRLSLVASFVSAASATSVVDEFWTDDFFFDDASASSISPRKQWKQWSVNEPPPPPPHAGRGSSEPLPPFGLAPIRVRVGAGIVIGTPK